MKKIQTLRKSYLYLRLSVIMIALACLLFILNSYNVNGYAASGSVGQEDSDSLLNDSPEFQFELIMDTSKLEKEAVGRYSNFNQLG